MYTVTRLAREAGATADAVRHYTDIGLLRPQRDLGNNYRRYTASDLQRLHFIRTSRELGFGLEDIRAILADADRGDSPCPQVRRLYERRLAEVDADIARLTRQRDEMRELLAQWKAMPDCVPTGDSLCHLVERAAARATEGCCHD